MSHAQSLNPLSLPIVDTTGKMPRSHSDDTLEEKFTRLDERLRLLVRDGLVVAFSGGVDSAFLLWAAGRAASQAEGNVVALTTVSESVPSRDLDDGVRFAERLGVEHVIERSAEMQDPEYVRNNEERCYYCKAELFRIAERLSTERGMRWIAYGYSASDRHDARPGHKAALERGVLSPLAEAGLSKDDIRTLMQAHGLELADKPASPCLSSRIMTGLSITSQQLDDVEAMETMLRRGGVKVCRVRVCDARPGFFLRIEVAPEEMNKVLPLRGELVRGAEERGYRWVTLDLAGYRTGGGNA
jgi:uncharacterized protein